MFLYIISLSDINYFVLLINTFQLIYFMKLHFTVFFRYLSMKAALLEPTTLHLLSQFQKATCIWLTQVVLDVDKDFQSNNLQSYCPNKFSVIEFPLPTVVPPTLK